MAQLGAATYRLMLVTTADIFEKYDNNVVFCIVGCRFSPEVLVLQWSWSLPRSMRPWGYLRLDSHGLDTVGLVNVTGVFHAAVLEKKRLSRIVTVGAIVRLLQPARDSGLTTSSLPRCLQHFVRNWKLIYFDNHIQTLFLTASPYWSLKFILLRPL